MPYIGTQPLTGQFKKLDAISVVNGQRQYTLNYNSAAYKPATANALLVSVNGVIQAAGDAYTIDGSTIEFTEDLVTGDVIDFIIALGDTGSAVTPVDGSVTTAKLGDDSVTEAKLATAVGVTTEYDMWRLSADTSLANDDTISSNLERVDTDGFEKIGTGMSHSSGVFTFPSTGFYVVKLAFTGQRTDGNVSDIGMVMMVSTDSGSSFDVALDVPSSGAQNHYAHGSGEFLVKVTNTSTFRVKFVFQTGAGSGTQLLGNSDRNFTYFIFTKIKDA